MFEKLEIYIYKLLRKCPKIYECIEYTLYAIHYMLTIGLLYNVP